jgi:SAM-dependent methyltransferase
MRTGLYTGRPWLLVSGRHRDYNHSIGAATPCPTPKYIVAIARRSVQRETKMIRSVLKTIPGVRPAVLSARRVYRNHFGTPDLRKVLAETFLSGDGIEIGALHLPLPVPRTARVHYVDRMPVADLRRHYPELSNESLVPVEIIDDGEKLATFEDDSQDFVIANHFLEHTQDPIGTIERLLQVLRPQGILYLAVPDKRFSFDVERPLTTLDHLIRDHTEGPEWSCESHFREWVEIVCQIRGEAQNASVRELMDMNYSIHFHVWTAATLLEFLVALPKHLGLPFAIEAAVRNGPETICVLRRDTVSRPDAPSA